MCQQICLDILKQSKKWMTARDIEKKIKNISIGSIHNNLKKLKKHNLVRTKKSKTTTKTNVKMPVTKYQAMR